MIENGEQPTVNFDKMEDTDWAYLAGLFDGEGSISMEHRSNNHRPRVAIGMNEGPWIIAVRKTKVGHFYKNYRSDTDGYSRQRYRIHWVVTKQQHVLDLLQNLLPYLRVKHDTALRMIVAIQYDKKEFFLNQHQMKEEVLRR